MKKIMVDLTSIRVKLHPTKFQKQRMLESAGVRRYAYNWALKKQMNQEQLGLLYISDSELRKEFTQLKRTTEYNWLNNYSNNITKQAIKDCCDAFQRYIDIQKERREKGLGKFSKKKIKKFRKKGKKLDKYHEYGHPKFKSKKDSRQKFYVDTAKIKFTENKVKLEKITNSTDRKGKKENWILLAEKDRIPQNCKYYNPRVTYDGESWWISVSIETTYLPLKDHIDSGIGIDLGIKNLIHDSNNNKVFNINKRRSIKVIERRIKKLQKRISKSYKLNNKPNEYNKTKNIIKKEKKLLSLNHKLTNIRQNHIHQSTIMLVKREPSFISMEDLNVKGMLSNPKLANAIQKEKFYEVRRQLEYKCKEHGIHFITVDQYFPSSKTCCKCGNIKKDLKLSERTYKCKECGNIIDRDYQAAINILNEGRRILSSSIQ